MARHALRGNSLLPPLRWSGTIQSTPTMIGYEMMVLAL